MTEKQSNQEPPAKLEIDDPSSFQFHAAYMVYSELFSSIYDVNVKKILNQNIEELKQNKISPEEFYRNIAPYRKDVLSGQRYDRFTVQTQRKRDWRMESQKQERIKRHRK